MSDQGLGDNESKTHVGSHLRVRFFVPFLIALVLLLVGVLVFRNSLLGDKVLLYKDIGADSVNDSYPYFVHLSDYIRHQGFPSWSFSSGMGQSLFYLTGNLIWEPVVWLPRQFIASALIYQHLLKALIAGLLFFRFVRGRVGNRFPALVVPADRSRVERAGNGVSPLSQRSFTLFLCSCAVDRSLRLETSRRVPCLCSFGDIRTSRRRFGRNRFLRERLCRSQ